MNAKMIIGICLVVFIVAGLIVLRLNNTNYCTWAAPEKRGRPIP